MKQTALVILLAIAATACVASPVPDFPFVFAAGFAEVKVAPDKGTISLNIKATAITSTNALAVVAQRSKEVLDFLASNKIPQKDIVAYEVDKSPTREGDRYGQGKIIGYEVSRHISLELRDLDRYERIVKRLLAMTNVVDVHTTFNRTDRAELEAELTAKACAKARANAGRMAKGFGVELGSVHAISETAGSFRDLWAVFGVAGRGAVHRFEGITEGLPSRGPQFLFVPSTITLQRRVNVLFRIKPAE